MIYRYLTNKRRPDRALASNKRRILEKSLKVPQISTAAPVQPKFKGNLKETVFLSRLTFN